MIWYLNRQVIKFFKLYLVLCLQAATTSFRLFKVAKAGLVIIRYFSQLHREQLFIELLFNLVRFNTFHVMLKSLPLSFSCQMYLLSSVLLFLFLCVKEALWFANLVLNADSVSPT